MSSRKFDKFYVRFAASALAATLFAASAALAEETERGLFVLTSTDDPSANEVVAFKLDTAGTPSLSLVDALATQGKGDAGNNAGILQFKDDQSEQDIPFDLRHLRFVSYLNNAEGRRDLTDRLLARALDIAN
jgi:hypothetical protein